MGDDWAEDHHDIEVMDASGRVLAAKRLGEGVAGIAALHALISWHASEATGEDVLEPGWEPGRVVVGIETDRGAWVQGLVAAGYRVVAVNPRQVARFRERLASSGAKSDASDAHTLADLVRVDGHQLRQVAGDSPLAEGIKVVARAHQNLIWDRTRHVLRLRATLREYFPAALAAFADLSAADTLELLGKAPGPEQAAGLQRSQIRAALKRARRHDISGKTEQIAVALRTPQLRQPEVLQGAYAASVRSLVAVIAALNTQIKVMQGQVGEHFGRHPDAEIYRSQPGIGDITGARVLAEFGDDPHRYTCGKARKNYAGTSPITRQSGKKTVIAARFVHNDRLIDALACQAQAALSGSPGARAYYQRQRARGAGHHAALRQLANRLVGILHGCLKTRTPYNETTAWHHHQPHTPNKLADAA